MTTIGKMLVIINFVISLAVGALILMVFTVSTNYRTSYTRLEKYYTVSQANVRTYAEEVKEVRIKGDTNLKKSQDALALVEKERDQLKEDKKDLLAQVQAKAEENKLMVVQVKVSTNELKRTHEELKQEQEKVVLRDQKMIELEKRAKDMLDKFVRADIAYRSLLDRVANMTQTIESLVRENEKYKQGTTTAGRGQPERRPPPEDVEGIIKATDARSGLVTISIGSDAGITKGNSLFVYRLKPEPKYLGEIRILEVNHHEAVGRPMTPQRSNLIQTGDRVASSIMGQR